jgi:hypothetical protein
VFLNNVNHEKVTHSGTLYENESVFGQVGKINLERREASVTH